MPPLDLKNVRGSTDEVLAAIARDLFASIVQVPGHCGSILIFYSGHFRDFKVVSTVPSAERLPLLERTVNAIRADHPLILLPH